MNNNIQIQFQNKIINNNNLIKRILLKIMIKINYNHNKRILFKNKIKNLSNLTKTTNKQVNKVKNKMIFKTIHN